MLFIFIMSSPNEMLGKGIFFPFVYILFYNCQALPMLVEMVPPFAFLVCQKYVCDLASTEWF